MLRNVPAKPSCTWTLTISPPWLSDGATVWPHAEQRPWPPQAIDTINAAAQRLARRHRHVEYLDCSGAFVRPGNGTDGGAELDRDVLPDQLHPNAAGSRRGRVEVGQR